MVAVGSCGGFRFDARVKKVVGGNIGVDATVGDDVSNDAGDNVSGPSAAELFCRTKL